MRKTPPPAWLTGETPAIEAERKLIRDRIRVRNWLRKRRANCFYRQAEVDRQRARRAERRA